MDLIIDTSSQELKVILRDKKEIATCPENIITKHQQHLLPEIDNVLRKQNKEVKDITNLSLVVGPGSFTGVRLAVATVKAFSYLDKNKKIIAINMLQMLGYLISKKETLKGDFCVLIKCTSSKCYVGHFDKDGKEINLFVSKNEDIVSDMQTNHFTYYGYNLDKILEENVIEFHVSNEDYIDYLDEKISKKDYVSMSELEPLYMALSQAEEELLKKQSKK